MSIVVRNGKINAEKYVDHFKASEIYTQNI